MKSLGDFENKRFFKAGNGQNGRSSKRFGKNGRDIIIKVPLGTEIFQRLVARNQQKFGRH